MDHVVYVDFKANELQRLLNGQKNMIIRGANGRKVPYDRVHAGDCLYLMNNNGEGVVKAKATVKTVTQTNKMSLEESAETLAVYQPGLQLTDAQTKRWSGKKFLIFIEVQAVEEMEPFPIDKSDYGNMDDWLPVESIDSVRA